MDYDPIKNSLGAFFNQGPFARRLFYKILDTLLLRSWHIHREIRKWKRSAPSAVHILDAGSGFGQYSWFMSKQGRKWSILGVDVKRDYVADCNDFFRSQNKPHVFFRSEDLLEFEQKEAFNLILSVDVMEHIEDDRRVFSHFYESLKTGGVLLISTPSDLGGSDVKNNNGASFISEHVRNGYSAQEIKEKLKAAGFCKVKVHYSYGVPGKLAWKMAMKWPMKMLNSSMGMILFMPFYYLIFILPIIILHYMDTYTPHRSGTGLIVRAEKNGAGSNCN